MEDVSVIIVGVAIMLAVPLTAMFANYIRKNVDHGEARFDADGKMVSSRPRDTDKTDPG